MQKVEKYSKAPILYSLAFHSLSFSKEEPNFCAKEFADYITKTNKIISKDLATSINLRISKVTDDNERKELMQACNLELNINNVEDLFPNLLKSKRISRDDLEALLRDASSPK